MEQGFEDHTESVKEDKQCVYDKHAGKTGAHELNVQYSAIGELLCDYGRRSPTIVGIFWKMLRTILHSG